MMVSFIYQAKSSKQNDLKGVLLKGAPILLYKDKNMLESFKPTWMIESIYQLTAEQLKEHHIKGVIADLDNTLIAWNYPDGTKETIEWIKSMKDNDIEVVILSNNLHSRVKRVADILDVKFVPVALKPLQYGFKKVLRHVDIPKENLIMVGDQILTDIKGANAAGIKNVLVKPIVDSDAWNTKINRFIELKIMNQLIKNDPQMDWRDSLDVKSK